VCSLNSRTTQLTSDRERLDSSVDEELGEDRLDLGLTRLEVVSGDEGLVVLGKVDATGNEGVLRRSVDEGRALENGSDGKDGRRSDLGVRILDGLEEVLLGVVDAGDDLGVALSVGSPEDDDLVEAVGRLELANVLADLLEVSRLVLAGNDVVGALSLAVGGERYVNELSGCRRESSTNLALMNEG